MGIEFLASLATFIFYRLSLESSVYLQIITVLIALSTTLVFGFWMVTMSTDASDSNVKLYQQLVERADLENLKVLKEQAPFQCVLCNGYVAAKTKHCGQCQKCVCGFDHHCDWLNNCIGAKNYGYFIGLVVSEFTLSILSIGFYATDWGSSGEELWL